METLEIKKENAIKAHTAGCSDVKKVLENLFGAETFRPKNIMDRIKTFEDACDVLGLTPAKAISVTINNGVMTGDAKSIEAYCKLIIIARALNEGWKPDWKNSNQVKYYPWFDLSSGSGLSYLGYDNQGSSSIVGSRLCFKSRELAEYAAKQFIDIYTEFFII